MRKLRRNAPCPCGSGIKHKRCCRVTQDPLEPTCDLRPGTQVRVVTDWYSIHDRSALARLLDSQPDVVGCEERGWSRLDLAGRHLEPLADLVIDAKGELEVSTSSEFVAETTRWWLERIASKYVTHEIGEVQLEEIPVGRASVGG